MNHKKIKPLKTYSFSIVSVFTITLLFSLFWRYFLFHNSNYDVAFLQSTLAVCIFLLIVFVIEIYKRSLQKEVIIINQKPIFFFSIFLKIVLIVSFLLFIMIVSPLLNRFPLPKIVDMTGRVCLFSLQFTLISFIALRMFYNFDYFRKKIVIGVFLASVVSSFLNLFLNFFWGENGILHFSLFFLICLFCCSLTVIMLVYNNKIQKLSLSFSKKETEYLQLKNQINPHFLFNNLNTLIAFIETNPQKAIAFGHHLSNVYRHYLKNDDNDFVHLKDELQFILEYQAIFKAKFESGFAFEIENEASPTQYILSLSLQELINNIFKHNILDTQNPIAIKISIHRNELIIRNTKIKKETVHSTKKGLENINKRYELLTKKEITVTDNDTFFEVKIPILHLTK
ncbi:hypothetical protein J2X31_002463 [Flavobacterium arsenatis]|uniref:Signal transduction histidine kinase internal region domain-containing protein n=1 Tax=Flavobacterium arsenatis TaxID=1484332 RepID=A0ABU1TRE6_9FLAO|nr:histidine kinase [Flavobacterium arsenatis]MDR6968440.1 hypothetical protein [Flavobacterium arsenatis]